MISSLHLAGSTVEDAPCVKQGKERKCERMKSNEHRQVIERPNARSSEEGDFPGVVRIRWMGDCYVAGLE
jgi:hypothetical protein